MSCQPSKPEPPIDPEHFVAVVRPQIETLTPDALLAFLQARWSPRQVVNLFRCHHADARKIAALCVSLVGTPLCIPATAALLREPCPTTNQLAEHALWSIWFRAGGEAANHQLAHGAMAIERRDYPHAVKHFDAAIDLNPEFAEAYNQRGVAHYLMDHYAESLDDLRTTVRLMPCHFSAYAGMGHTYVGLDDLPAAIESYDLALEINPHMHCVRETVTHLKRKMSSREPE